MTGPEGKSPEDARLDALLDHIQAVESTPTPKKKPSLVKQLLPMVLAQAADLASTEKFLGGPDPGYSRFETNPLPGMQSSAGRIGWGALETALVGLLLSRSPKLGKVARDAAVTAHTGLAVSNDAGAEENADFINRSPGLRPGRMSRRGTP